MKDLTHRFRPFDRFENRPAQILASPMTDLADARYAMRDAMIAAENEDLEAEAAR